LELAALGDLLPELVDGDLRGEDDELRDLAAAQEPIPARTAADAGAAPLGV